MYHINKTDLIYIYYLCILYSLYMYYMYFFKRKLLNRRNESYLGHTKKLNSKKRK